MSIRDALCKYVAEELLETEEVIEDDENLLADGMVDSMGMLRLVTYIDEVWNIKVPPEDFTIENFRTVNNLADYLDRKLAPSGA